MRAGPISAPSSPHRTAIRPIEGAFFLLPIEDCEIIDNWFVNGLAGTGSKDIAVHDAFVPARRILMFSDARAGTTPGAKYHQQPDLPHAAVDPRRLDAGLDRGRGGEGRARQPIWR